MCSDRAGQLDLFSGGVVDEIADAKASFGVCDATVWPCNLSDPRVQRVKTLIADWGEARAGDGKVFFAGAWREVGTSAFYTGRGFGVFNPQIASWILNGYAPRDGVCFDPFAGGGTRAIMAAKHGLEYVGVELRAEEVAAVRARCAALGVGERVRIIEGDARSCPQVPDASADFLITCPPYWNLEQYDGGDADLSMAETYEGFNAELQKAVHETARVLKPGAVSCWVVGLHRDEAGSLCAMNHDVARMHRAAGFRFHEEVILHQQNTGAIQRVGNFEKGRRFLIRVHEYAMIFMR